FKSSAEFGAKSYVDNLCLKSKNNIDCIPVNKEISDPVLPPILSREFAICKNAVKNIFINIIHNGTDGITEISYKFTYSDVIREKKHLRQEFHVNFHWAKESVQNKSDKSQIENRSGNPGYVFGKRLLFGNKDEDNNVTREDGYSLIGKQSI